MIPSNQKIYINSSDGRIFDFATPSSRVYLGETINSLLRPFGKSCVLAGLTIKSIEYTNMDIVKVTLNPGEVIIDTTFIDYPTENEIELDVSGYDENAGFLILSVMFNFVPIMQKNFSKLLLTYVNNDGVVPNRVWYNDCENIVLAKINFNKVSKVATTRPLNIIESRKILIEGKQFEIYPLDNISKRISALISSYFHQ